MTCQPTTQIPGPQGETGAAGNNGVNAFSIVQTAFTVPAINSSVTVIVDQNLWFGIGQPVYIPGAGFFSVNSIAGTTTVGLTYLNYVGNTYAGTLIAAGTQISPGGSQYTFTNPLPVGNGGTDGTTAAGARTNLGAAASGVNSDITSLTGLTVALSIAQGGTGATTAVSALAALGIVLTLVTGIANGTSAVIVAAPTLTANSVVIPTLKTVGGTVGALPAIQTVTPGTGFTFKATASDTSTYSFLIIN